MPSEHPSSPYINAGRATAHRGTRLTTATRDTEECNFFIIPLAGYGKYPYLCQQLQQNNPFKLRDYGNEDFQNKARYLSRGEERERYARHLP